MPETKHVGRIKSNKKKVIVAYRTLPGESDSALVVMTESLTADQHDSIMKMVESPAGQSAYEFAEVMARVRFPDNTVMLSSLHLSGRLVKVKTSEVEMIPNSQISVGLDQLNQLIAEQKGVSVNDLALGNNPQAEITEAASVSEMPVTNSDVMAESQVANIPEQPLSDTDLAKQYRSQADRLSKEAANLRRMAEELVPTKKKTSVLVDGETATS
jgi:hypothetical protein